MTLTWVDAAKLLFVLVMPLQVVPLLVWLERKLSAWIQGRVGPNRVGPFGLLQPLADAIKFIFKEDIFPAAADRFIYLIAPMLVLMPPLLGLLVLPFSNHVMIGGTLHEMVGARLPIGILWLMSVLSIGVYGIAFGGWASNSKYSLLGGLRSSAQMISYELTLGLTLISLIMISGSVDPVEIVQKQARHGWNVVGGGAWYFLPSGLLALLMLYIAGLAENNRLPFDLPECESELVGGYHTEYSSMKFAMFFMGEYVAMITMSSLITTLLLGGWHFPGLTPVDATDWVWGGLVPLAVFGGKVMAILCVTMWVRWTLPRFKYTQLMNLGWKVLVPVALVNLAVVGVAGVIFKR
jgi:NADH-quinone oxidoreductase subunit H